MFTKEAWQKSGVVREDLSMVVARRWSFIRFGPKRNGSDDLEIALEVASNDFSQDWGEEGFDRTLLE